MLEILWSWWSGGKLCFTVLRNKLPTLVCTLLENGTNRYFAVNLRARFFYSQFRNENVQNVKCACSFIPNSYSGMDRTPFHPFCSQGQNEQNVANAFCTNHSNSRIVNKKTRSSGSISILSSFWLTASFQGCISKSRLYLLTYLFIYLLISFFLFACITYLVIYLLTDSLNL